MPIDGHVRASGRLYLSLTNPKKVKNKVMSEYHSNEELLKVHAVLMLLQNYTRPTRPPLYTSLVGQAINFTCVSHYSGHKLP